MNTCCPLLLTSAVLLSFPFLAAAQQPTLFSSSSSDDPAVIPASGLLPSTSASPVRNEIRVPGNTCLPLDIQTVPTLTFRQRACFYEARLIKPSFAARAAIFSAFAQLRNEPHLNDDGASEFGRRFAFYYARRTAQSTGELLAGYLNREDPRYHPSRQEGIWNRTKAALLSVALTTDAKGGVRPALGPIAGSFGSGMVGIAFYQTHNSVADGFRRTGFAYGGYVGTAVFREFKPDISTLAARLLHRKP